MLRKCLKNPLTFFTELKSEEQLDSSSERTDKQTEEPRHTPSGKLIPVK
jgi:hypothetical protein